MLYVFKVTRRDHQVKSLSTVHRAQKWKHPIFKWINFFRTWHRACSCRIEVPHFEITSDEALIVIVTLPPDALTNRKAVAARTSIASPAGPNIFAE